jgi:hypothetical protein
MRHARSLGFDDLEARKLLTAKVGHHLAAHSEPAIAFPPAEVAIPLTLDGTLTANVKAATIVTDSYGDQTTVTPVSGVLAGVGAVRGTWNESANVEQQYLGPDSIQLHNAKGSFVLAFDATALGQGEQTPQGTVYPGAALQFAHGAGAYAKLSVSGFIQENTNARATVVESLQVAGSR